MIETTENDASTHGHKAIAFGAIVGAIVLGAASVAGAQATTDAVDVATTAGTAFKDTGLAVIVALVPLAVVLIVAKRAFAMARGWVG